MRNFFLALAVCVCFYACKPGIPEEIIQPDRMQEILFDIHITDGYLNNISNPDSAKRVAASYYRAVYKKFNIDSAHYSQSMNYYYSHPDLLENIYGKLLKTIENEREKYQRTLASSNPDQVFNTFSFYTTPVSSYLASHPVIGINPFNLFDNPPQ